MFFRSTLFIAGVINFLPSLLVFFPDRIQEAYDVNINSLNLKLLLMHRAVLFGLIGGLMIYSSLTKLFYNLSFIFGFISMGAFVLLFFLLPNGITSELRNIMLIDIITIVILLIGFFSNLIKQKFNYIVI